MNTKKLTESMEHLSDRYIEEALDTPIRTSQNSTTNSLSKVHLFSRKYVAAAAMLCIGIGIGYTVQYILPDNAPIYATENPTTTPKAKNGILSLLTVTAYAAERSDHSSEEGVPLEENVPTALSQNSSSTSNIPAMPFSFSYPDEVTSKDIYFVVTADDRGFLQKYQQSAGSWEITEEALSLTCKPDEKIYWQPSNNFPTTNNNNDDEWEWTTEQLDNLGKQLNEHEDIDDEWIDHDTIISDSLIKVRAYAGETILETQYIGISYQDTHYTATPKLCIVPNQNKVKDDFSVTSKRYETTDEEVMEKINEKTLGNNGQAGTPSHETDDE